MSGMMDGVVPRSVLRGQPMSRTVKLPAEPEPASQIVRANLLDLRPSCPAPAIGLAASVAVAPMEGPNSSPRAARKPLGRVKWLLAGGVSVMVVAVGILGIKAAPSPAKGLSASAPAAMASAAPAPTAPAPVAGVTSAQIKALLDDFSANAGAPVYLVVKDLKTGQSSSIGADQAITSASLYKLFVAQGIYRLIDTGQLSLSSKVPKLGSNIGDCLTAMITVSDNDCGVALEGMLGDGGYNQSLSEDGFTKTRFDYPTVTSAGDVGLLLERLYNSTLLSPSSSEQFIGLLKNQRINNRLPQGLPAGTVIAHKTGDVFSFVHDAGIVYGPKTDYLVVMMSGPWNGVTNAPPKFAELSGKLYALFNQ